MSDPDLVGVRERAQAPPVAMVERAIGASVCSPCRSKRGSVLFRDDDVIAHGFNYKPLGFQCDGSAACKATCRVEAIHAEQQTLLFAGTRAYGCDMLHVKTVDKRLVASGGPSCVQCSKLALVAGVRGIWLYHESGWQWYPADEWHRLSLETSEGASPWPGAWQPMETAKREANKSILLWKASWDRPRIGTWFPSHYDEGGGFWESNAVQVNPSKWMPLPPLPDHETPT